MESSKSAYNYSGWQLWMLVLLRLVIGWHFLYEGIVKLMNPAWSSLGYLLDSKGLFSGLFHSMAASPGIVNIADFLNMWGLIAIGLGLILGCFTRIATIAGIVLLAFYCLAHPSGINTNYILPSEGNYLWVNKTVIELFTLVVLYLFPTGRSIGLDRLIFGRHAGPEDIKEN